jgi:hypothetical protein
MGVLHSNGMLYEDLWNLASLVAHLNSLLLRPQQPRAHHSYPPRLRLPTSTHCPSAVLQRPQCSLADCRRSMLHAVIRSAKKWCSGSKCTSAMFAVSQQKGYGESLSYPSANNSEFRLIFFTRTYTPRLQILELMSAMWISSTACILYLPAR